MNPLDQTCIGALFTVGLGSLVGGLAYLYRWWRYKRQEGILHELAELRTTGVKIRNDGLKITDSKFENWNARIEEWKGDLYAAAWKFSPVESQRLETLDWFPYLTKEEYPEIKDIKNTSQIKVLSETSETLARLDRMLEKRFRPTHSP